MCPKRKISKKKGRKNMINTIGNTPLIKIKYQYQNKINYIYTKLESYNLTGSIKDRTAYYIITKAKQRGVLKDEMPIIEATSRKYRNFTFGFRKIFSSSSIYFYARLGKP